MAETSHRKLAALMFTDMVGYSALTQKNEALALALLQEHRRLLRPIFPRYGGTEVKTIGDAFLVEFPSAVEAARCAIEIQRVLREHNGNEPAERQMQHRIGLHVGDVVYEEADVFGDGVNIASRLQPLADPGGICLSEDVARQIQNKIELPLLKLGPAELKNIQMPVAIYRIVLPWEKAPHRLVAPAARAWVAWRYRLARRRWWLAAGAGAALVVLVAVFVWLRLARPEAPAQALTIKALTSFVGLEWGVTWSPDASFIAYAHNKHGHMDVFALSTGGGDPVRVTDNPADDLTPRWSPDGRYIAFVSDRGTRTNVYLIPPLGGVERKLVETNIPWLEEAIGALYAMGAVPWSPEASQLLFSRLDPTGEIAVWKINLSTGVQTQLTKPPPGAFDLSATWSFDGKRIAFTRNQGGKHSLWLMDAQGGEPELLLADQYVTMTPAWSADSQRLVFVSNRGGRMNLWDIEVRSGRLRQVTTGPGTDFLPVVSSTGRVAYTQYSHQVDLYWGRVDEPQEKHQRLTAHTMNNFGGRVSPDGQQVAYHSDRTGNYELWLLDRRTGAERQLTDHPANDIMGDWSPDGREIVFLSDREGSLQPWVLEVESGRLRRVSEKSRSMPFEPHFSAPRWSPDGKAIGFIAAGEKEEGFWVVDPQGKNVRSPLAGVIGFDWYRASRHVLYTRKAADGSGVTEMRVADLETGKEVVLLRGPTAEMVVARDGRGVAYLHSASHFNMQLQLLRLAPPASPGELPRPLGKPQQLTRGEGAWHVHNGGWSPDGKAIVYTRDNDSGDIYVIQNYR